MSAFVTVNENKNINRYKRLYRNSKQSQLARKEHSTIKPKPNRLNIWVVSWDLTCMVHWLCAFVISHTCCSVPIQINVFWNRNTFRNIVLTRKLDHFTSLGIWWSARSQTSCCGFEFRCSHVFFRYCACFEQGGAWNSNNYGV